MSKKCIKITITLILLTILALTFYNSISLGATFNPTDYKPTEMGATEGSKIKDIGNTVIGAVQLLGSFLSIVTLIILGIRYMAGSVEERAEYKRTMLPYLIGAVMVFGISNVLAIIIDLAKIF